jgi:hypothetical protein
VVYILRCWCPPSAPIMGGPIMRVPSSYGMRPHTQILGLVPGFMAGFMAELMAGFIGAFPVA